MAPVATANDTLEKAWSKTAPSYASNVGRASSCFANRLVELANSLSSIEGKSSVLDVGAGTGAVTLAVAQQHPGCHITAVDISPDMLSVIESCQNPNITTKIIDAVDPKSETRMKYSHAFSSFMLQTTTEPMKVLKNIHNRLKDGGIIGLAVWGPHIDPDDIWKKACQTIDPNFEFEARFDDPEAWRTTDELKKHIEDARFGDVLVEDVTTSFAFESTDAFVDFWFNSNNPAALSLIKQWKGGADLAREAVKRICTDQYDSGKGIKLQASLGVGRKLM